MPQAKVPSDGNLLTVEEVVARLSLKPSWVYTHADQLGAYRLGKYLRFGWDVGHANTYALACGQEGLFRGRSGAEGPL
jgi:hypothetical protein